MSVSDPSSGGREEAAETDAGNGNPETDGEGRATDTEEATAEDRGAGTFDHRRLDQLVHSRVRLAVLSILAAVADAQFTFLRDRVKTTDGNLAGHLRKLEDAGYVEVEKEFVDRKPMTRYRLSAEGREAFRRYVDRLEAMVEGAPEEEEEEGE